jgi:heme exporter protein A
MPEFAGIGLTCVRGERQVFVGVDFRIRDGGALVLSGPNGSGKSSLLRLMAGLAPPAAGAIVWDGVPVVEDPEAHRARLHYVGHLDALKATLTVAENVMSAAALRGQAVGTSDVAAALEGFGLAGLADLPARYLSQGQRRRTALARLLAAPAPLWLLDEPTLALDRESVERLGAAIARHRRTGGRVVVATHVSLELATAETLMLGRPA